MAAEVKQCKYPIEYYSRVHPDIILVVIWLPHRTLGTSSYRMYEGANVACGGWWPTQENFKITKTEAEALLGCTIDPADVIRTMRKLDDERVQKPSTVLGI